MIDNFTGNEYCYRGVIHWICLVVLISRGAHVTVVDNLATGKRNLPLGFNHTFFHKVI